MTPVEVEVPRSDIYLRSGLRSPCNTQHAPPIGPYFIGLALGEVPRQLVMAIVQEVSRLRHGTLDDAATFPAATCALKRFRPSFRRVVVECEFFTREDMASGNDDDLPFDREIRRTAMIDELRVISDLWLGRSQVDIPKDGNGMRHKVRIDGGEGIAFIGGVDFPTPYCNDFTL